MNTDNQYTDAGTADSGENRPEKKSVGQTLKRERVKKRLSIAHIAEDLKFNEEYIEALENSEFDKLPAPPYVRVYIKTLAGYLGLDSQKMLSQYAEETGSTFPDPREERHDTMTVRISDEKNNNHWIAVSVIIVLIGAFVYLLRNQTNTDTETSAPSYINTEDSLLPEDTGTVGDSLSGPSGAAETTVDSTPADTTDTDTQVQAPVQPDSLNLRLEITRDSTWMRVYADGRQVKNGFYRKGSMTITARDSFNLNVGKNGVVSYRLNGNILPVPAENALISKITGDTLETW
ncbi:MAG: RodZ domain-containing protein [Fibrobacterota bacterium]